MADLREIVTRKVGPMPVWGWSLIVAGGVGAMMILKKNGAAKKQPAGAGTGPGGGDFTSSQSSTTTDANGNTTTSQYSANGQSPFGVPGFLTQQAGIMPYSLGDIYNNISTTVPQGDTIINIPGHPGPPPGSPPPQQTHDHDPPQPVPTTPPPSTMPADRWGVWTVRPGDSLWLIASETLKYLRGNGFTQGNPTPSPQDITSYWQAIYARNHDVIGSNPGLIHPGQQFVLPK